jgi:hypothetical protein
VLAAALAAATLGVAGVVADHEPADRGAKAARSR